MTTVDPALYQTAIDAANANGIPPSLFLAQIAQESSFNPSAVNGNAWGIAQFQPSTAEQYGVSNPFDPSQSLYGAAAYDASLFQKSGSYTDMLRGYGTLPTDPTAPLSSGQSALLQVAQAADTGTQLTPEQQSIEQGIFGTIPGLFVNPNDSVTGWGGIGNATGDAIGNAVSGGWLNQYFIRGAVILLGIIFVIGGVFMLRGIDPVEVAAAAAAGA